MGKHMKKPVPSRAFMIFLQNVALYVYFTKSQITKENTVPRPDIWQISMVGCLGHIHIWSFKNTVMYKAKKKKLFVSAIPTDPNFYPRP